jgi:hypothetical protein
MINFLIEKPDSIDLRLMDPEKLLGKYPLGESLKLKARRHKIHVDLCHRNIVNEDDLHLFLNYHKLPD